MNITLAGVCAALVVAACVSVSEEKTLYGKAQKLGNGKVRTYAELDAAGRPAAIGILATRGALQGLPRVRNRTSRCYDKNRNGRMDRGECEGDTERKLAMPAGIAGRKDIPFRWVGVNWNPEGHPPPPWSAPHFDFHFYIASRGAVDGIRVGRCNFFISCRDKKRATRPVPAKYVAPGHINVNAAVSKMGNHLIDSRTPELAKKPKRGFTHTWIFGAYDGHITFYEPMITHAFLVSQPDVCTPIRQPKAWEIAGYYPTRYCIRYRKDRQAYAISMEGFVRRAAE